MNYSTILTLTLATLSTKTSTPVETTLEDSLEPTLRELRELVAAFHAQGVTPAATAAFEQRVELLLREVGRLTVQHTYNALETAEVQELPKHVHLEGTLYTRLNRKTRQNVWTLFGQISLRRVGYRSTCKNGEPTLFPLAHSLGLLEGASPALASRAGSLLARAGMTQKLAREQLRHAHGVGWGVKKLRLFLQALAQRMANQRHDAQVARLLALLQQASASTGTHKPVLAVGRDGITLGMRVKKGSVFEVATAATVTVYDRRGKRQGTVYLAYVPESGQGRMSKALTRLLDDVFKGWQGPLPRLCYVTDAGTSETSYYQEVLAKMLHPRTGERLKWIRVVDYYHASQRLWAMAEALFGKGPRGSSWVRKMQRWLLKPGGVNRVLHSAAAYQSACPLKGKRKEAYEKAYHYLRRRLKYLRYEEYRRRGLPIGSGVTEAACKTVYTQRLKLSGMRWHPLGAQNILELRVLLLSGVWDQAFLRVLQGMPSAKVYRRGADAAEDQENAA